jgi:hypothetical protein
MFDFSNAPASRVTPHFWVYWAVTIPLTLITLAAWKIWMNLQNGALSVQDNLSSANKMLAVQGALDENLASNTPLYLMRLNSSDGFERLAKGSV